MHSSCFGETEELIALLHDFAGRVGTISDEHEIRRQQDNLV
jgi:hypothetical protein